MATGNRASKQYAAIEARDIKRSMSILAKYAARGGAGIIEKRLTPYQQATA